MSKNYAQFTAKKYFHCISGIILKCVIVFVAKINATSSSDTTVKDAEQTAREQTTLIPNEAEAFALEPMDVTSLGKIRYFY